MPKIAKAKLRGKSRQKKKPIQKSFFESAQRFIGLTNFTVRR
jgi:hypothetical protein